MRVRVLGYPRGTFKVLMEGILVQTLDVAHLVEIGNSSFL